MTHKFEQFIFLNQLLQKEDKIIVGVSGGVDSMVLLTLLKKLDYHVIAAHCNYKLREKESDIEEEFVKLYCQNLGIQLFIKRLEHIESIAQSGTGIQEFARNFRYEWFEKLLLETQSNKIATAHHADDQLETILFNLTRGSGLNGMRGIALKQGNIVRPLLCFEKEEIIKISHELNIPFKTDSSNLTEKYTRNKIRHQVLPILKSINKNVSLHAQELSEWANFYTTVHQPQTAIGIPYLLSYQTILEQKLPKQYLLHLLKPFGFNKFQIADLLHFIYNETFGKKIETNDYCIYCNKTGIEMISKEQSTPLQLMVHTLPFKAYFNKKIISIEAIEKPIPLNEKNCLFIGLDELNYPLILKPIEAGDRFSPFGMKGHKTISNYFTDKKTQHAERNNAIKLCIGTFIAAVIPGTIDNAFAVDSKSKIVLKISF
jgi:tRNA(Ile)-lysidine synthase